jgi:RND family efflux transporter MFP subunit
MRRQVGYCLAALLAAAAIAVPLLGAGVAPAKFKGYQAISKPSKDVTVSFVRPGRVVEVRAAKGDEVKANQLIARQDDDEEQAALVIDKLKSEDETKWHIQETNRDSKTVAYEKLSKSGGAGPLEIAEAKLNLDVAQAEITLAKLEHDTDILKYKQSVIAVEKLKVFAPISGVVAEEFLKAGESADGGNMKLVRIVQLDPLWVEVPVPFLQARKLKKDDPAIVTFSDAKDHAGKVAVVSPIGDSASETLLVRVEVPNPEKIPSGENVFVNFGPAPAGVARNAGVPGNAGVAPAGTP